MRNSAVMADAIGYWFDDITDSKIKETYRVSINVLIKTGFIDLDQYLVDFVRINFTNLMLKIQGMPDSARNVADQHIYAYISLISWLSNVLIINADTTHPIFKRSVANSNFFVG